MRVIVEEKGEEAHSFKSEVERLLDHVVGPEYDFPDYHAYHDILKKTCQRFDEDAQAVLQYKNLTAKQARILAAVLGLEDIDMLQFVADSRQERQQNKLEISIVPPSLDVDDLEAFVDHKIALLNQGRAAVETEISVNAIKDNAPAPPQIIQETTPVTHGANGYTAFPEEKTMKTRNTEITGHADAYEAYKGSFGFKLRKLRAEIPVNTIVEWVNEVLSYGKTIDHHQIRNWEISNGPLPEAEQLRGLEHAYIIKNDQLEDKEKHRGELQEAYRLSLIAYEARDQGKDYKEDDLAGFGRKLCELKHHFITGDQIISNSALAEYAMEKLRFSLPALEAKRLKEDGGDFIAGIEADKVAVSKVLKDALIHALDNLVPGGLNEDQKRELHEAPTLSGPIETFAARTASSVGFKPILAAGTDVNGSTKPRIAQKATDEMLALKTRLRGFFIRVNEAGVAEPISIKEISQATGIDLAILSLLMGEHNKSNPKNALTRRTKETLTSLIQTFGRPEDVVEFNKVFDSMREATHHHDAPSRQIGRVRT